MTILERRARDSLVELVKHVFVHRNGLISRMTYEELAQRIGRMNRHGAGHGRGMGKVLGKMGHLLRELQGKWGEHIPDIQSLVVLKTGPNRGLPDTGIDEFWPGYPQMSRVEKENRVRIEHQQIVEFGSRWNDVLTMLGLPTVNAGAASDQTGTAPAQRHGGGVESEEHRRLKEYIRDHPEIVGAAADWQPFVEYPLPSLDAIDVVFKSRTACIAVEVKSVVSDALLADYERGLFQTIKYEAQLKAMALDRKYGIPPRIQSILVLESALPPEYKELSEVLGVRVLENIKPTG